MLVNSVPTVQGECMLALAFKRVNLADDVRGGGEWKHCRLGENGYILKLIVGSAFV
jgi:hypothetical protein